MVVAEEDESAAQSSTSGMGGKGKGSGKRKGKQLLGKSPKKFCHGDVCVLCLTDDKHEEWVKCD